MGNAAEAQAEARQSFGFHPAAEIFPLMSHAEFDGLLADMREHGQREPIVLHQGKILDGRNRYRACQEIGCEPATVEWDGIGTPESFVISHNLHRRHLNESQRAMIAGRLATLKPGHVKSQIAKASADGAGIPASYISVPQAGELLNVNRGTVSAAKLVLAKAEPDEIAAVERGELAVSTLAKQIRQDLPAPQREKARTKPLSDIGGNVKRIQNAQLSADIWARMKDTITHLNSFPLPSDVVEMIRANVNRSNFLHPKLPGALAWLQEFSDAWHRDKA